MPSVTYSADTTKAQKRSRIVTVATQDVIRAMPRRTVARWVDGVDVTSGRRRAQGCDGIARKRLRMCALFIRVPLVNDTQ